MGVALGVDRSARNNRPPRASGVRRAPERHVVAAVPLLALFVISIAAADVEAVSPQARESFQRSIIDSRSQVNRRFKKVTRKKTDYIIVHTAEGGLQNTLNVVLNGKRNGRRRLTHGGHAHYVIARDGRTYRTLDKRYRADHAGLSMWNGRDDISDVSIGIELVGYHHTEITARQYHSLSILIDILQGIYRLDDRAVLTHSQVAYGRPNRWFRKDHRGRKRCAKNFVRRRAGLRERWTYDPDVRSGRLTADEELDTVYYGPESDEPPTGTNIITAGNTAWMIAGEDFNEATTLYRLPNGKVVPGNRLGRTVGWRRIPVGTEVLLNTTTEKVAPADLPVATLTNGQTAWTFAGVDYNKHTTLYIFPSGRVKHGGQINDWDGLPPRTRIAVGYHGPYRITRARPPVEIAGQRYRDAETLYLFPEGALRSGREIRDFRRLPRGVRMLVPVDSSLPRVARP